MKLKYVVLLMALLVVGLASAYAGNADRIGTAGAMELRMPVGSRGTAMGGSIIANASGIESMCWNPAGLASMEGSEAAFTHVPWIADINLNYVGVATNIESFGTIGLGAKIVSAGEWEETTEAFPDGTGRTFNPTLSVINLSYARVLTANVSFGVTAMFINEDIFEVTASGMAFDVGFMYDPGWHGVKMGLAVKNFGPEMQFSGRGFERSLNGERPSSPNALAFDLPASLNIGMAWDCLQNGPHTMNATGNFLSNSFGNDGLQGGLEYAYNEYYFLRAGYNWSDQKEWLYGPALGAGLVFPLGNTKLKVDYSWNRTKTFDDNQFFTVGFVF
jgi:hypothetical protein